MVEIFANRIEFLSGQCMKNVGRNFISEARRVRRARLERWRLIVRSLGEKRIEVGLIVPHLTRIAWLKHGTARWFSYLSRVVAIESRNSTLLSELLAAESALRNPSAPLQIIPLLPFLVAIQTRRPPPLIVQLVCTSSTDAATLHSRCELIDAIDPKLSNETVVVRLIGELRFEKTKTALDWSNRERWIERFLSRKYFHSLMKRIIWIFEFETTLTINYGYDFIIFLRMNPRLAIFHISSKNYFLAPSINLWITENFPACVVCHEEGNENRSVLAKIRKRVDTVICKSSRR